MIARTNWKMTGEDLEALLDSMRPVPLIALQCGMPRSQQENANAAWARLGEKMNFDPMTVQPTGRGDCFFSAIALPEKPQAKPHLKMDGNQWCATGPGFTNLQESPAGFGDTPEKAIADLQKATP